MNNFDEGGGVQNSHPWPWRSASPPDEGPRSLLFSTGSAENVTCGLSRTCRAVHLLRCGSSPLRNTKMPTHAACLKPTRQISLCLIHGDLQAPRHPCSVGAFESSVTGSSSSRGMEKTGPSFRAIVVPAALSSLFEEAMQQLPGSVVFDKMTPVFGGQRLRFVFAGQFEVDNLSQEARGSSPELCGSPPAARQYASAAATTLRSFGRG